MWSRILIWVLLLAPIAVAQEQATEAPPQTPADAPAPEITPIRRSLNTLAILQRDRGDRQAKLKDIERKYAASQVQEERMALFEEGREIKRQLDQVTYDYETIATGVDVRSFDMAPTDAFDLPSELERLVQPLVEELKDATAAPRNIERLRSDLEALEAKEQTAKEALASLETLIAALTPEDSDGLNAGLVEARNAWQIRIADLHRMRSVARFQLDAHLANQVSVLESTRTVLSRFFRTRGLNLILAIATFLLILIVLRGAYRGLLRLIQKKTNNQQPIYARVLNVLYVMLTGFVALGGALLVLYATGDWVLLGVIIAFLVGLAWAGKTAVPLFMEQGRLLLNLGTVRERERVMIDGIPYRVSKLSFYTLFSNSELAGGVRRLPLADLSRMRSRTSSRNEIWFPTKRHDWVILSDGVRGQVIHQSPDSVQLELMGGSHVTYRTADFLGLAPRNLSRGFRVSQRFGVDYQHRTIATTEVPRILTENVRAGLEEQFGSGNVRRLKVDFLEAAASSLDYSVLADMGGFVARDYEAISRAIQRLCVETCNEMEWTIPFKQVMLHRAEEAEEATN
ncbi:MAG: hypothetical protein ACI8QZ_003095 [Chlamydiales bacterium]|jgi:hypothetical protein